MAVNKFTNVLLSHSTTEIEQLSTPELREIVSTLRRCVYHNIFYLIGLTMVHGFLAFLNSVSAQFTLHCEVRDVAGVQQCLEAGVTSVIASVGVISDSVASLGLSKPISTFIRDELIDFLSETPLDCIVDLRDQVAHA